MRTIIINTSKEAKNAKLDILFNAPFGRTELLRYECELDKISSMADEIKQALIFDADTIDRDYNLIVLVDLYEFPRGNDIQVVNMYKQLVSYYIGRNLIFRLKEEFNLLPGRCAIFYADSADKSDEYVPVLANEKVRSALENRKVLEKKTKRINADADLGAEDEEYFEEPQPEPKHTCSQTDNLLMELFSWNTKTNPAEFTWKLRCSVEHESYLDFSDVFSNISSDIVNSHHTADILGIALTELKKIIICNGDVDSVAQQAVAQCGSFFVKIFTCKFNRDNEQSLKEGFFKVYANLFSCVQQGVIPDELVDYSENEIRELLVNALRKYSYFLDGENISVDFKPVASVLKKKDSILKAHKAVVLAKNPYKDFESDDKVARAIMESAGKEKSVFSVNTEKMHGIDLHFHRIVDEIFNNYDPQIIKKQNDLIVQNCRCTLWEWRDRCTEEDFARIIDEKEADGSAKKAEEELFASDSMALFAQESEQEYNRLIGEITSVEHRLSANKNILLNTQNAVIKYGSLMRKSRRYLISFIGAIIAILASCFPFLYMRSASTDKMFVPFLICLCFTAGFALAYAVAAGVYMYVIKRKKLELKQELSELKEESESDRRESIITLYHYYTQIIVEANCHYLLRKELLSREKENARKGIMRNAHITHLTELRDVVDRYITMFKINTSDFIGDNSYENLVLKGEEPYYSDNNRLIYSILPERQKRKTTESGVDE